MEGKAHCSNVTNAAIFEYLNKTGEFFTSTRLASLLPQYIYLNKTGEFIYLVIFISTRLESLFTSIYLLRCIYLKKTDRD